MQWNDTLKLLRIWLSKCWVTSSIGMLLAAFIVICGMEYMDGPQGGSMEGPRMIMFDGLKAVVFDFFCALQDCFEQMAMATKPEFEE